MSNLSLKRIANDWKQLQADPIAMANARPCDESDITLWDGVIGINLDISQKGKTGNSQNSCRVPLHFVIDFPKDYPQSAPNIGFSVTFPYNQGASYVKRDGRLKDKFVVCLDLLGNFDHVHTEWKAQIGSGWTPAYSVSTLLVNLVALLSDLNSSLNQDQRNDLHERTTKFLSVNASKIPHLFSEDELRTQRIGKKINDALVEIDKQSGLREKIVEFAKKSKIYNTTPLMEEFARLCLQLQQTGDKQGKPTNQGEQKTVVDKNIVCFASGSSYTTDILGYGISTRQQGRTTNLATAGELLSKTCFDGGLRQDTTKAIFEYFLPAFINPQHASDNQVWRQTMDKSIQKIGQLYGAHNLQDAVVIILPRLINTMVVDIMKPETPKAAALAMFEVLCSLWRTFYYYIQTNSIIEKKVSDNISSFTRQEKNRQKNACPDIGALLACFTACPPETVTLQEFAKAYIDENGLRNVMWWKRDGVAAAPMPVFEATNVSRNIAMFQFLVLKIVVGGNQAETAATLDATNGKSPDRLEKLLKLWKAMSTTTDSWKKFFDAVHCPCPSDLQQYVTECVVRASKRGPAYIGKGGGRRRRQGK